MMDYSSKHEFILYGWYKKHKFYGGHDVSIWEHPRPNKSDLHPTMKPVELITRAILNSSEEGDIVYDPFLGSGSTLIACEASDRICYGFELEPHYCDVIIKRFKDYSGKDVEKL